MIFLCEGAARTTAAAKEYRYDKFDSGKKDPFAVFGHGSGHCAGALRHRPQSGQQGALHDFTYLVMPCVIISSFQVKYQPEILNGLLLALATAVLLHLVLIVVVGFLGKVLKLDGVEETSLIYSNAGNLIIPIVTAILGKEWFIYTSAFLSVQLFLLWSHAKMKLCGEKGIDLKKILTNINMIAIFAGVLLFLLQIQLPAPVQDAVDSISSMVGPMGMLILGMLIAEMDLKKLMSYHRLWWITLLRLVGIPLIGIVLLKYSSLAALVPEGRTILLVTLLPSARRPRPH